ncbi:MAG: DUF1579 domain-containing protein [Ignavibacteriales bacterium]|nr:MAG: DUF1579 domain-containing protein [Ignavibacteriales bacterium]
MNFVKKTLPVFAFFFLINCSNLFAQEGMEMSAEEKAWMEYMTPGKAHQMLAESVGSWKVHTKMWMDPSAPPMESDGTSNAEMILGGRYLQSTFTGTMMGMPFEGISMTGFDNAKKEFFNTWIDNMGTGLAYATGKYNEKNNSTEFKGMMVDPMTGKDTPFREVFKMIDKNKMVMEMYWEEGGKEFLGLELTYTR